MSSASGDEKGRHHMNPMLIILITTVSFVILAYVGYTAVDAWWLKRNRIRRRIMEVGQSGTDKAEQPPISEFQTAKATAFPTVERMLTSRGFADKLLLMLTRAGVKLRPSEFIGIVGAITVGLLLIVSLLADRIVLSILALMVGLTGPFIYLKMLQARRLITFNRQLPDTLALMASAIRSGYGFARAVQLIAEEMPDPISDEFQRVLNEMNVGLPMDMALMRMVHRVGSYDFELVATAVIIQQSIGGNLAEIIDNIAATIRDRVRVEGEMSALTAEGRISGVILVALPFAMALIISIINPGYLKPLVTDPRGIFLVIAGVCAQIIGALVIRRMLILDY